MVLLPFVNMLICIVAFKKTQINLCRCGESLFVLVVFWSSVFMCMVQNEK